MEGGGGHTDGCGLYYTCRRVGSVGGGGGGGGIVPSTARRRRQSYVTSTPTSSSTADHQPTKYGIARSRAG